MKRLWIASALVLLAMAGLITFTQLSSSRAITTARQSRQEVSQTNADILALIETKDQLEQIKQQGHLDKAAFNETTLLPALRDLATTDKVTATLPTSVTINKPQPAVTTYEAAISVTAPNASALKTFLAHLETTPYNGTIGQLVVLSPNGLDTTTTATFKLTVNAQ